MVLPTVPGGGRLAGTGMGREIDRKKQGGRLAGRNREGDFQEETGREIGGIG